MIILVQSKGTAVKLVYGLIWQIARGDQNETISLSPDEKRITGN